MVPRSPTQRFGLSGGCGVRDLACDCRPQGSPRREGLEKMGDWGERRGEGDYEEEDHGAH